MYNFLSRFTGFQSHSCTEVYRVLSLRRWLVSSLSILIITSFSFSQQKSSTPAKAKQEVEKGKESTAPKKGEQPSEMLRG